MNYPTMTPIAVRDREAEQPTKISPLYRGALQIDVAPGVQYFRRSDNLHRDPDDAAADAMRMTAYALEDCGLVQEDFESNGGNHGVVARLGLNDDHDPVIHESPSAVYVDQLIDCLFDSFAYIGTDNRYIVGRDIGVAIGTALENYFSGNETGRPILRGIKENL